MNAQGSLFGPTEAPGLRPWQRLPAPNENAPAPVHRNAADTERRASELVTPKTGTLRALALDAIARAGDAGFTHEELADYVRRRHYSIAPRVTELVRLGWVIDSGRRRKTETQSPAIVWVLSERGRGEYAARGAA